jgi:hypothetical protein
MVAEDFLLPFDDFFLPGCTRKGYPMALIVMGRVAYRLHW